MVVYFKAQTNKYGRYPRAEQKPLEMEVSLSPLGLLKSKLCYRLDSNLMVFEYFEIFDGKGK